VTTGHGRQEAIPNDAGPDVNNPLRNEKVAISDAETAIDERKTAAGTGALGYREPADGARNFTRRTDRYTKSFRKTRQVRI